MKNNLYKISFAIGIIFLFIGVSIVPSFNAEIISTDNIDNVFEEVKDDSINIEGNITAYHENWIVFISTVIYNKGNERLYNVTWEWYFFPVFMGYDWERFDLPIEPITGYKWVLGPKETIRIPTRVKGVCLFQTAFFVMADGYNFYELSAIGIVIGSFVFTYIWPI